MYREYMRELRNRLFIVLGVGVGGFALGLIFAGELYHLLSMQVVRLGYTPKLMHLQGGFSLYVKLGFLSALFVSLPVLLWHVVAFVRPALYPSERRLITWSLFPFISLLTAGMIFSYVVVAPATFSFFDRINNILRSPEVVTAPAATKPSESPASTVKSITPASEPAKRDTKRLDVIVEMNGYLRLLAVLMLGVAILFEVPYILVLLTRVGVLSVGTLRSGRPYFLFGMMVLVFLLTPDPISSLLLGVPMYLMFEGSIWAAAVWEKNRPKMTDPIPDP